MDIVICLSRRWKERANEMLKENVYLVYILIVFLHVIADFLLQNNFLATYKQKKNWEPYVKENSNYKYDYIVVLLVHSFIWAFVTFSPILFVYKLAPEFIITIIINTIVHGFIDHLKCNRNKINLITDQFMHLVQISVTLLFLWR